MIRISSGLTFFQKRVFPALWFGFLGVFVVMALSSGAGIQFLLFPLVMATFGFFMMRRLLGGLADEVFDCGDSLLVKYRDQDILIPLKNIMNVSASTLVNPPRITLRLIDPVPGLGSEVSFSPARGGLFFNPFARNEIAEELILRVHRARTEATA